MIFSKNTFSKHAKLGLKTQSITAMALLLIFLLHSLLPTESQFIPLAFQLPLFFYLMVSMGVLLQKKNTHGIKNKFCHYCDTGITIPLKRICEDCGKEQ